MTDTDTTETTASPRIVWHLAPKKIPEDFAREKAAYNRQESVQSFADRLTGHRGVPAWLMKAAKTETEARAWEAAKTAEREASAAARAARAARVAIGSRGSRGTNPAPTTSTREWEAAGDAVRVAEDNLATAERTAARAVTKVAEKLADLDPASYAAARDKVRAEAAKKAAIALPPLREALALMAETAVGDKHITTRRGGQVQSLGYADAIALLDSIADHLGAD